MIYRYDIFIEILQYFHLAVERGAVQFPGANGRSMTKGCAPFLRGGSPGASHQLLQRSLGGSGDFGLTAYERNILNHFFAHFLKIFFYFFYFFYFFLFLLFLFHLDSLWAFCTWTTRYDRPKKFPDGPSNAQDAKGDAEFAATIHSNLAAAYAKKGDHDKALAAAEEAWFDWPWAKCLEGWSICHLIIGDGMDYIIIVVMSVKGCDFFLEHFSPSRSL